MNATGIALPPLLKSDEVQTIAGCTRQHLLRLEKAGQFPRRVRLGHRRVAWLADEINNWLAARCADRGGA